MAFLPPPPGQGDNSSLPETEMDAGTVMDGNPHQRVLAVCYDLCQPSASLVYLEALINIIISNSESHTN